ncbi:uncharacterized protein LOC113294522 [Papaver somniferum]|uniref:uncharacterized protein LOC113294522 n=1 Tax=Papaver somniferum TaxID=3469 RepID=UPI000E6FDBBC|nr:uncharacterized protein LOC113294522 [Papaver somniferum]
MKLADIIQEGLIPSELQNALLNQKLPEIYVNEDEIICNGDIKGKITIAAATNKLRHKETKKHWSRYVWNNFLHPSVASNVWKLIQGVYIDDDIMVSKGYELASRCCVCEKAQDSMQHLLWECTASIEIWEWISGVFKFKVPKSFEDVWKCAKHKSSLIQEIWITASCVILKEIWFQKNKEYFEEIKPNTQGIKIRVQKYVQEGGIRMKGYKWNQEYDDNIISFFNLGQRASKYQCIKACYWNPPTAGYILFCCDGSSFGNPGTTGFGIVIRDEFCKVIGTLCGGIGVATNYITENYAVVCAAELAMEWGLTKIVIRSDSKAVLQDFEGGKIPWFLKSRWRKAKSKVSIIRLDHCFREINFLDRYCG